MVDPQVKLQVLICTHRADGLARVANMALPAMPQVEYIVCCQSRPLPVPHELADRDDIRVSFFEGTGLSNNRNNALGLATADYVLFGDDDLMYLREGLRAVIDVFDEDPDLGIACFKQHTSDRRDYPDERMPLRVNAFKPYYAYSSEMAFRREHIERHGLRFSPLAGINAPFLGSGEEDLFLHHALNSGLKGCFYPVYICRHPHHTTTGRRMSPSVIRARGAVLRIMHPYTSPLRMVRLARIMPGSTYANLRLMIEGWRYASRHRHEL